MSLLTQWRALSRLFTSPRALLLTRIGLTVAGVILGAAVAATHKGAADFDVFWTAAHHWWDPYDPKIIEHIKAQMHITGYWPFAYPPTFLLFLFPFGQMPLQIAYPLWAGISLGTFALVCSFVIRPMLAALLVVGTPALAFAITSGQSTLLMGSAVLTGFLVLEKRPILAGILFGVAACIKPQAMVLAPIVLWGHWRTMGAAAVTGMCLVAASLVFGPEHWLQWPKEVLFFHKIMITTHRVNPSALFDAPWWTIPVALFGVYLAWTSRDVVGLVGGFLCLTPYAHDYDLVCLAPVALTWLFNRDKVGWDHAILGAIFMSGLLSKPGPMAAFLIAIAVVRAPWWPLKGFGMQKGAPVARSPLPKFLLIPGAYEA